MLRMPGSTGSSVRQTGIDALDYELAGEIASALGHAGLNAQKCVANLLAFSGDAEERVAVRRKAVDAVYAYFIQRELAGMRRHDEIIREFNIPKEVLVRLGQVGERSP